MGGIGLDNLKRNLEINYPESIEYALKEKDRDSLFVKKGTTYKLNIQTPQEFSFSPFGGIEINNKSYFKSDEDDAFVWLKNDSVMVNIPSAINGNEVYIGNESELYSNITTVNPHKFEGQMETTTIPTGKSEFYTEIQFRKRIVSYALLLTNKRTKEKKTIEGKWVEIAPTGKYTVKWED